MAYYIFLKSLRRLEEFRKNPIVKIPPKSPPTKFQRLAIIKNQIFIQKRIFLHFGPKRPSGQSARPASQPGHPPGARLLPQAAHARSAHPGLRGLGVIARRRLFFEFAQPDGYAFSLCHRHAGPTCQLRHLPRTARPRLKFPCAAAPRATRSLALDANQSTFCNEQVFILLNMESGYHIVTIRVI
jgi:hypothetical protein